MTPRHVIYVGQEHPWRSQVHATKCKSACLSPLQFVTQRLFHTRAPSPANPRQSRARHPELQKQRQTQNQSTSQSTTAVVSSALAMRQSSARCITPMTPRERVCHPPGEALSLAEPLIRLFPLAFRWAYGQQSAANPWPAKVIGAVANYCNGG